MKIWLINPYGPIPTEAWRVYCFALIAKALAEEGHDVIWWTSNFAHHFKLFRSQGWEDIVVEGSYKIRLVPTPGYTANISFGRIFRDFVFAWRTYLRGRSEAAPDLIVFSESPLTFGFAGQRLADHFKCPSIYHQMDLWPELIVDSFHPFLRAFVRSILYPVYLVRKLTFNRVSAVTALASAYLSAVFVESESCRSKPHAVVYNGIDVQYFRASLVRRPIEALVGREKRTGEVWAVFAGSLGPSYDIEAICEAATLLAANGDDVTILIAGDGPRRDHVSSAAVSHLVPANLIYIGQLKPKDLIAVYSWCDIGLCAYSASSNVEMPDKIYDYCAAGLAVIGSLRGEVSDLVSRNSIGVCYQAGSGSDLYRSIIALASDFGALESMKVASYGQGLLFDSAVQCGKFVSVVNTLCDNKK